MVGHQDKIHHLHKRKIARGKKPTSLFDKFMYLIAIVIPLLTIPQIILIWVNKSAQDISLITWGAYLFSAICWLIYSIIHKEKPLIANSILWVLLEALVIVGVIIYG